MPTNPNKKLKDRAHAQDEYGLTFKLTEALSKLESTSSHLTTAILEMVSVAKRMTQSGGHAGLTHALLYAAHGRREPSRFWQNYNQNGRLLTPRRNGQTAMSRPSPSTPPPIPVERVQAATRFSIGDKAQAAIKSVWAEFTRTGRRSVQGVWDWFKRQGATKPGEWPPHSPAERIQNNARTTLPLSSFLSANALHATSPDTFKTLERSWQLFEAKAGRALIKPAANLAFKLQDMGEWIGRQPQATQNAIGLTATATVAGSAAVLTLGALGRAIKTFAETTAWASRLIAGSNFAGQVVL